MPEFISVLGKDDIEQMVALMARRLSTDYQERELVMVGILKGAFIFLSDLVRQIAVPVKIDFVGTSSYSSRIDSSGNIRLTKELETDVAGKDVLIVEDIIDTGLTAAFLVDYLKSFNPETIKVCTLVDKYERREAVVHVDYACHVIQKGFLVGYGLDYADGYRQLPAVYEMKL